MLENLEDIDFELPKNCPFGRLSVLKPEQESSQEIQNFLKQNWQSHYETAGIGLFHYRIILKNEGGEVIGFRSFEIFDNFVENKRDYKLWLCVVSPRYKRKGIAKYLTVLASKLMREVDGFHPVSIIGTTSEGKAFVSQTKTLLNDKEHFSEMVKEVIGE